MGTKFEQLLDRGREQGLEQGQLKTLRDKLPRLLKANGLPVTDATRQQINQADLETLDRWADRIIDGDPPTELTPL